jgi:hypothetical protein
MRELAALPLYVGVRVRVEVHTKMMISYPIAQCPLDRFVAIISPTQFPFRHVVVDRIATTATDFLDT